MGCFPSVCRDFPPTLASLHLLPCIHFFTADFSMVHNRLIREKCLILQLTLFLPTPRCHVLCCCDNLRGVLHALHYGIAVQYC